MILDRGRVAAALPAYEIGEELGRGGWGVVVAGRHRQLGREVAIKELPRAFGADPGVRARFAAEARLLASLDSPHIVPVYDYVEADGTCLLVMEKLTGGTVWERFTSGGLTMADACAVLLATCSGLHFAHGHGILHRDVKPENLMFSSNGTLKVTDFGIAKVLGGGETMATAAGEVLGTPAYMAPEQAEGAELSASTDVYAAAVMLYELLAGRLPFSEEGTPIAVLYRHVHEQPEALLAVAPAVPPPIAEVTMRALAKDPAERFATAEVFGVALAEAATAAWGPGWLAQAGSTMVAAGPLVAATERPSPGAPSSPATAPGVPPTVARAERTGSTPPTVPSPESSPAATLPSQAEPAAATTRLRPPPTARQTATHQPRRPMLAEHPTGEAVELVPVRLLTAPPPIPTAALMSAGALLLVALALALLGLGDPDHSGELTGGELMVGGRSAETALVVDLDLSEPVEVAGALPPAAGAQGEVQLSLSVLGIPLGSARSPVAVGPDGRFATSVDAGDSRYLAAGLVTGEVVLAVEGLAPAAVRFGVAPAQPWPLTAPGAAAIALGLFVLAYAESLFRSLRHGHKRVTGIAGLVVIGALFGVASVAAAWLTGARQPVVPTLIACATVGGGAGAAAGVAGLRLGRRRRHRRRQARQPRV